MPVKPTRKWPKQARSRATVTAILDAMTRILNREHPDAATTTHIAEVAGISIGTLYQYFSHRDAILDALQDREFERAMELMQRVLAVGVRRSARDVARQVVDGLMQMHNAAPGLHRVLAVETLRVSKPQRVQAFDLRVIAVVRSFLSVSGLPVRRDNIDAAAFVIFQAVRATMLARLVESPAGLDDETLATELTDLVVRYLIAEPLEASPPISQPVRARVSRSR
jgi:AcrR family transcriptional regulator